MSATRDANSSQIDSLRQRGAAIMESHWRSGGFTCPNADTYPWLWLWDSCFHSIIWAHLGREDRAVTELATALSTQDESGFVPHLSYLDGNDTHSSFWGRSGSSSITQPPIYGHAVAELVRLGIDVPEDVIARATKGLRFLLNERSRSDSGLIELVHPWESGCDDSPRWDDLMVPAGVGSLTDPYDKELWFARKGELLGSIVRNSTGAPIANPQFAIGSVAFNAITSFCAEELASITGDDNLKSAAAEIATALRGRWNPGLGTWVDDGSETSGQIRTLEGLLPLLVESDPVVAHEVVGSLVGLAPAAGQIPLAGQLPAVHRASGEQAPFAADFGLWQVHPSEARFSRGTYWRGPTWPQLDYLMWQAVRRQGMVEVAAEIARRTRAGALQSGFAEFWDADSAAPGGAVPQSWTVLSICMETPGHKPTVRLPS